MLWLSFTISGGPSSSPAKSSTVCTSGNSSAGWKGLDKIIPCAVNDVLPGARAECPGVGRRGRHQKHQQCGRVRRGRGPEAHPAGGQMEASVWYNPDRMR
mmetsp:Transcript_36448/g.84803  ORF Transcript_36448/g.84803 Transcript_36448/m.84803 type:complete len:100 (-) Transcript_36448:29-328(-)